jgi:hypothetical protein
MTNILRDIVPARRTEARPSQNPPPAKATRCVLATSPKMGAQPQVLLHSASGHSMATEESVSPPATTGRPVGRGFVGCRGSRAGVFTGVWGFRAAEQTHPLVNRRRECACSGSVTLRHPARSERSSAVTPPRFAFLIPTAYHLSI